MVALLGLTFGQFSGTVVGAAWLGAGETEARQAAAPPATTLEEYEKVLRLALRQIESARTANENVRGVYLNQAVLQLQSVSVVELAAGAQIPVDNQWLIGELKKPQPDLESSAARLRVLIDELHDVRTSRPEWRTDPEVALQRILAQKQYQWDKPPRKSPFDSLLDPLRKWLNDLRERIWEWLRQHLPEPVVDFAPGRSGLAAISWWVYALGAAVVLTFIVFVVWNVRRQTKRRVMIPQQAVVNEDQITTTADAFAAANQLAGRGDYRSGIRALYLAALLHLHERELLKYDRTLTNREHLREVRANRPVYEQLVPLVTTFDRVWYGQINPTAEEFERFHHGVEGLRQVTG